jgi:hypothetical protein
MVVVVVKVVVHETRLGNCPAAYPDCPAEYPGPKSTPNLILPRLYATCFICVDKSG